MASPKAGEHYFDHNLGRVIEITKVEWDAANNRYVGNVAYREVRTARLGEMRIYRWREQIAEGQYERLPE